MFCKESACEKAICHLCLIKSQKFHDVVNLEEERKENYRCLVEDMEEVSNSLVMNKKMILSVQENFEKRHEQSLEMLKLRKEELVRRIIENIDKLQVKLSENKTKLDTEIRNDMETIEINIDFVQSLQGDVNETSTLEDIKMKREIVNNICDEIKKRKTNSKSYTLLEYHTGQLSTDTLEHLCGKPLNERRIDAICPRNVRDRLHHRHVTLSCHEYQHRDHMQRLQVRFKT